MTATSIVSDVLVYLLCTVICVTAGMGFLTILGVRRNNLSTALLAPVVTQAFWANCIGIGVALGVPVRWLAAPIWLTTFAAALYGWCIWRRDRTMPAETAKVFMTSSRVGPLLALCAALPILVVLPYFTFGLSEYPGSGYPDGWAYVADGQYLWTFPRGTTGGLNPLYQYAAYLTDTRHISSAQMGLLSVLTSPGDVQSATGLFLALSLFGFASACAAFGTTRRIDKTRLCLFLTVTVLSGWSVDVIIANNYDNLLALSYAPALVSVGGVLPSASIGCWVLAAGMMSGLLYTFPEVGAILFFGWVIIAGRHLWSNWESDSMRRAIVGASIAMLLLSPYARTTVQFLVRQTVYVAETERVRPGEGLFPGLLAPSAFPAAFWGLGAEHQISDLSLFMTASGVGLFVVMASGIRTLWRSRDTGILAVLALPLIGAPTFLVVQTYPYGAYKLLLIGWWAVTFTLVTGLMNVAASRLWAAGTAVALIVVLMVPLSASSRIFQQLRNSPMEGMSRFRVVEEITRIAGHEPVGLFVEDGTASQWAVYFLRDHTIRLGDFSGYLALDLARPYLAEAAPIPWPRVRYLLTDETDPGPVVETQRWTTVWQGGAYRLWDTADQAWVVVTDVSNHNGIDRLDGAPFVWLGGGPLELGLVARQAACVRVNAEVFPGPSLEPSVTTRLVRANIRDRGETWESQVVAGPLAFQLPVTPGENIVQIEALDQPTIFVQSNGDVRPLVLGVRRLQLESTVNEGAPSACGASPRTRRGSAWQELVD